MFEAAALRLGSLPGNVVKDFRVYFVLDVLYDRLPGGPPDLLFNCGMALSKVIGFIERFSEDIDLGVYIDRLGFEGEREPTATGNLANKIRTVLLKELRAACRGYFRGVLKIGLTKLIEAPDKDDVDGQTLSVEYLNQNPSGDISYVAPPMRIEAEARSALDPSLNCTITPYVGEELPDCWFDVGKIRVNAPELTYWKKPLILHGTQCPYGDPKQLPADRDCTPRHNYDIAMITATETGRSALSNIDLLDAVLTHNHTVFRRAWKKFKEATPGSVSLVPQPDLRTVIERDYGDMQSMNLGDVPAFGGVREHLQYAEAGLPSLRERFERRRGA